MDENGMNANDAVQGRIGDCYFITAASLIAAGNSHYFMGHLDPKILNQLEQNIYDNKLYENLCSGVFPPIFHMYAKKGNAAIQYHFINDRSLRVQIFQKLQVEICDY